MARIIVVEERKAAQVLLCSILERAGHEVIAVADAAEALRMLRRSPAADMLITDIDRPSLGGMKLLENLEAQQHIKKIALTLENSLACERRTSQIAGVATLTKPIDGTLLHQLVDELLEPTSDRLADARQSPLASQNIHS